MSRRPVLAAKTGPDRVHLWVKSGPEGLKVVLRVKFGLARFCRPDSRPDWLTFSSAALLESVSDNAFFIF